MASTLALHFKLEQISHLNINLNCKLTTFKLLLKEYMIDIDRLVSVKCNVTFLYSVLVQIIILDFGIIFCDVNIVLGVIATRRPHNCIVMYDNMQPMMLKKSF